MQVLDLIQGSDDWIAARAKYFTASEAAAMMGASKHQTRSSLLKQKHTGMPPDVDAATQRRFDEGHAVEAAARIIVETRLGVELFPVTAALEIDGLPLLASFDGLTFNDDLVWECKLMNADLKQQIQVGELSPHYYWQLEQQLLVSGAERAYFTPSDGTEEGTPGLYYESVPERRAALIAGWKQFAEDLANYQEVEVIPAAVAAAQPTLPAVSVQVTGQIAVRDNLTIFGDALKAYIERINKQPETDQDFADLDATVKKLKEVEECLSASEASAIAQTGDVDLLCRTINDLRELARANRLTVEKLVKAEKENRKNAIIEAGKKALAAHIQSLNDSLKRVQMPNVPADFNGCAKNLRTIDSLKNAVDTCLANAKIEANQIADGIRFNLTTYDEIGAEYPQLFPDLAQIVTKAKDDFTSTVKLRIAEHKEAERARAEKAEEQRKQEEQRQRNEAAMSELQAIQQQVTIATGGRLGVRQGGTIECIRETLVETVDWVITEEKFGALFNAAKAAKDKAVMEISQMLVDAEQAESARQTSAGEQAAKVIEQDRKTEAVFPASPTMEAKAPAEQIEARNVTRISASRFASGQPNEDLITDITQRLQQMDRQQLNLVLMFCKEKIAA